MEVARGGGGGGGAGGGGGSNLDHRKWRWRGGRPMVRLSHREFNLVPERTSGMKNENKGLRITYFINFLASSLITQISYEAL